MRLYTCDACMQGRHLDCEGEHRPPPGHFGGSKCDCSCQKPQTDALAERIRMAKQSIAERPEWMKRLKGFEGDAINKPTDTEQLRECPNPECHIPRHNTDGRVGWLHLGSRLWQVKCYCGAAGPEHTDQAEAARLWNALPRSAAQPGTDTLTNCISHSNKQPDTVPEGSVCVSREDLRIALAVSSRDAWITPVGDLTPLWHVTPLWYKRLKQLLEEEGKTHD